MLDKSFAWTRIAVAGYDYRAGWENFDAQASLADAGLGLWGAWYGLFGLRANELIMVTHADLASDHLGVVRRLAPGAVIEQYEFVPTVRPSSTRSPDREGLYVFRFFDAVPEHFDEIVALSNTAWTTFENADSYVAEPQALFAPRDRSKAGRMLLLTWYESFNSWVTSRQPAPEARENFMLRRSLTDGSIAFATRLVGT
jgi:hypothetical protein